MLGTGGTYYTFVDSGPFTVQYSSFTNMDEMGVQLWNTGPFFIHDSTFDYSGNGVISTSTLLTLTSVSPSTITLIDVTYGNSRPNTYNYSYNIVGSSTGLQWANGAYSGALTGPASTEDDQTEQHILWGYGCETENSLSNGAWSAIGTWDKNYVPTSCNPVNIVTASTVTVDISSAIASTTTINGQLSFSRVNNSTLTIVGGNVNVNAGGTLDMGSSGSPINVSSATLILAYGPTAGQFGLIVSSGSNFTIYGAAKTPATLSTGNILLRAAQHYRQ